MMRLSNPAPYGWEGRGWSATHRGIDYGYYYATPASRDIHSAAPGVVCSVYDGGGYNQGWGNQIILDHGADVYTTYNHLAPGGIHVSVGEQVTAGQQLGVMGTTGDSTGIHLHFELRLGSIGAGARTDPAPYFYTDLPGIPDPAPTPAPDLPTESEPTMIYLRIYDGQGRYGTPDQPYYATYDGHAFVLLNGDDATQIAIELLGGRSFPVVSYGPWEGYRMAASVVIDARTDQPTIITT